ncbi:cyclase-associated protein 1-like [Cucumis melo var. makuwa]|uniref:Cyclase-associated protein 1-like n=1 Tax=Cucumis melo var. makuwa TaxID=1194695 RepID=A0A5A7T944_CUCMM|nr:cyclase-associated protein 1-like [Cucumis melo var. makuwa]TYK27208.1 cyclase-associated protein 1-like [Cucumis melo var. makuwa]
MTNSQYRHYKKRKLGIRRPLPSYYDSSLLDGSATSKNILSERNRRRKLNERLFALRSVVQNISKKPDLAGLAEFLKQLNEVTMKANALIGGRRHDFFNHLKATADSLSALAWIAFTEKDCGMSMPIAHVQESWQMAEFYNNKLVFCYWKLECIDLVIIGMNEFHILITYSSIECSGKTTTSAAPKASPPPPPLASLFSSEPSQASSSKLKERMVAVFQEINYRKPVTLGLKKVTDDMKTKNRADRVGILGSSEKRGPTTSP